MNSSHMKEETIVWCKDFLYVTNDKLLIVFTG